MLILFYVWELKLSLVVRQGVKYLGGCVFCEEEGREGGEEGSEEHGRKYVVRLSWMVRIYTLFALNSIEYHISSEQ